jgi:hypothetical protein
MPKSKKPIQGAPSQRQKRLMKVRRAHAKYEDKIVLMDHHKYGKQAKFFVNDIYNDGRVDLLPIDASGWPEDKAIRPVDPEIKQLTVIGSMATQKELLEMGEHKNMFIIKPVADKVFGT